MQSVSRHRLRKHAVGAAFGFSATDVLFISDTNHKIGVVDSYYGPLPNSVFLRCIDHTITPSVDLFTGVAENNSIRKLSSALWASPPVNSCIPHRIDNVISVYLDRSCFLPLHDPIVLLLTLLENTNAKISVLCGNRLQKKERSRLRKLCGQQPERIQCRDVVIGELDCYIRNTRVLLYPGCRSSYGFPAFMAIRAGVPFVVYGYGAFVDILAEVESGLAVPCRSRWGKVYGPNIVEFGKVSLNALSRGYNRKAMRDYLFNVWESFRMSVF